MRALPSLCLLMLFCNASAGPSSGNWTVIDARWRPDANSFAKQQVWEGTFWTEGWSHEEQFFPTYFRPAGSMHVIMRNDSPDPDALILTHIDDKTLAESATTPERIGSVVWYFLECPNLPISAQDESLGFDRQENVPSGAWVNCTLRMRQTPVNPVSLRFRSKSQGDFTVRIPIEPRRIRMESVSFSSAIDRIYIYIRSLDGKLSDSGKVRLDCKPCRARWTAGPTGSGLALAEVELKPEWNPGSYHLVEVETGGERIAESVRAWDGFFCIGLFGEVNPDKVRAAREHGINTYFAAPSETLDRLGMSYIPHSSGQGKKRAPGKPGLLFHYNHDEPDAHDYTAGQELPVESRLGVNANNKVLPLQRYQRMVDPEVPNLLLVDNTYKPAQWYVYGQIPDVFCTDPYVPLNGRQIDYVWRALECARDASTPRPLISVLWACSLSDSSRKFGSNPPTPEEERMAVFYSLGCGTKGYGYFIDMSKTTGEGKFTGLSDIGPLWEEVGRINKDAAALAPLLAISCPIGQPEIQNKVWTRALMCGADRMILFVINTNHYIAYETRQEHSIHIPVRDVRVRFVLPRNFRRLRIEEVKDGRLVPAPARIKRGELLLSLEELVTARAFILTKENE